jgi:hypothetical protein
MLQQWYPLYQDRVDATLSRIFDERYKSTSSLLEGEFESAMRYAVE